MWQISSTPEVEVLIVEKNTKNEIAASLEGGPQGLLLDDGC